MAWTKQIQNSVPLSTIPEQEASVGFMGERHTHFIDLLDQGLISNYTYSDSDTSRTYSFYLVDQSIVNDFVDFNAYLASKYPFYIYNMVVIDVNIP